MVAKRNFKMIRFGSIIIFRYVPDTSNVSETLNGLTSFKGKITKEYEEKIRDFKKLSVMSECPSISSVRSDRFPVWVILGPD